MVVPAEERPAGGDISADGKFTLSSYERFDGVVTGTHKVAVRSSENISEKETRWLAPPKYSDPETSGLEVTIEGPTDNLKIELTWDGRKPFVQRF